MVNALPAGITGFMVTASVSKLLFARLQLTSRQAVEKLRELRVNENTLSPSLLLIC